MLRARHEIGGIRAGKAIRIRESTRAQPGAAGSAIVSTEYTVEAEAGRRANISSRAERRAALNISTDPIIATTLDLRL